MEAVGALIPLYPKPPGQEGLQEGKEPQEGDRVPCPAPHTSFHVEPKASKNLSQVGDPFTHPHRVAACTALGKGILSRFLERHFGTSEKLQEAKLQGGAGFQGGAGGRAASGSHSSRLQPGGSPHSTPSWGAGLGFLSHTSTPHSLGTPWGACPLPGTWHPIPHSPRPPVHSRFQPLPTPIRLDPDKNRPPCSAG